MPSHDLRQGASSKTTDTVVVTDVDTPTDTTMASGLRGHGGHGGPGGQPMAAPTINELVDQIFVRFDADANGTIAVSELLAVLDPDGDQPTLQADLTTRMASVDTNADAGVSRDEITTALTALDTDGSGTLDPGERPVSDGDFLHVVLKARARIGDPADRSPLTVTEAVDNIFTVFDTDGSDLISMDELLAHLQPRGRKGSVDTATLADKLVALIDSDGDGTLSVAEVTAVVAQLDTDLDGTLDSHHGSGDIALIGVLLHAHPADTTTVLPSGTSVFV